MIAQTVAGERKSRLIGTSPWPSGLALMQARGVMLALQALRPFDACQFWARLARRSGGRAHTACRRAIDPRPTVRQFGALIMHRASDVEAGTLTGGRTQGTRGELVEKRRDQRGAPLLTRSGSPQPARIAVRTRSRRRTAAAQSWPSGRSGALTTIWMRARLGNHCPSRNTEPVPRTAAGTRGVPTSRR
jgi:hypothetical protein